MALTRKSLSAMGIEPEKIDEIITLHSETVEALKEQRDGYKAEADKVPEIEKERDDISKELDKLKKDVAKDEPYKQKYEDVKKEFEGYKADITAKDTKAKVTEAFKSVLKDAKIADKYVNVIVKATDMSDYKLDDDGNLEGADKVKDDVAKEWAEFIETTEKKSTKKTETPPSNNGGSTMTKEEIMKIKDRNERQKAISEHHELFGY